MVSNVIKKYVNSQKVEQILQLKSRCQTEEEYRFNWTKILSSLSLLGMQCPLQIEDFVNPSHKDMLLFCTILFFSLPHYHPAKEPIPFECILGDSCSKYIELENNTIKMISYQVRYEGSLDF